MSATEHKKKKKKKKTDLERSLKMLKLGQKMLHLPHFGNDKNFS